METVTDPKKQGAEIGIQEIMKIIPHRYPFLLIDRVLSIDPPPAGGSWVGRKCQVVKNVTFNEPFFTGHFPEVPIMPGVLIIEAMAQAAAILAYRPDTDGGEMEVRIASVDGARFRRPVTPGDQLKIHAELKKDRGSIFAFHCEAYVDGQLACEADILAKSFNKVKKA